MSEANIPVVPQALGAVPTEHKLHLVVWAAPEHIDELIKSFMDFIGKRATNGLDEIEHFAHSVETHGISIFQEGPDEAPGFDRQAARTSGVTVDVTAPGGIG